MNSTLGKVVATGALVGALAIAAAVPTQAAQGRNAAFAAGVRRLLRRPSLCLWLPTVRAPLLPSPLVQIAEPEWPVDLARRLRASRSPQCAAYAGIARIRHARNRADML